jgi:hypothetical protein
MSKHVAGIAVLFSLFAGWARAEAYEIPLEDLRDTAHRYLTACVSSTEQSSMARKFSTSVKRRVEENDANEDTAMRAVMLDWAIGAKTSLKKRETNSVRQACFYFVAFIDRGYDMPQQVRAELTENNVKDILQHLKAEIQKHDKLTRGYSH